MAFIFNVFSHWRICFHSCEDFLIVFPFCYKIEQHIKKAEERDKELTRQMQTLEGMIMHQIKHSGAEKADANLDFEGRLHWHIQMSTGKHTEIVSRVQALEDLVMHQNNHLHLWPDVFFGRRWVRTTSPRIHETYAWQV